jgi:hypothetical protein
MTVWSSSPFPSEVELGGLGPAGDVLSSGDGESVRVYELARHPGWLVKEYRRPLDRREGADLAGTVTAPAGMGPDDRDLVDRCTGWPVARITDGGSTTGVVLPQADERFRAVLNLAGGRKSGPVHLTIDWLVQESRVQQAAGLTPAGPEVRRRAALHFLAVGALLERHGLVYGDWSYRNAFWAADGGVCLIDMDSCRPGSRPWVESGEWADPLYPAQRQPRLDAWSDRYKLAVLTVRCLTGLRGDPRAAWAALPRDEPMRGPLGQVLTATAAGDRCSAADLLAAAHAGPVTGAKPRPGGSNVTGARPVGRRPAARPAAPHRPTARPVPPAATTGTGAATGAGTGMGKGKGATVPAPPASTRSPARPVRAATSVPTATRGPATPTAAPPAAAPAPAVPTSPARAAGAGTMPAQGSGRSCTGRAFAAVVVLLAVYGVAHLLGLL